ncbi:MAG: chemotaxis protein [Aquabacterium sp.]|uniref:chemotaxis protein n=1 Tax=Aquabacterium sp. TaxID=1872578 RepID=UPI003BB1D0D1
MAKNHILGATFAPTLAAGRDADLLGPSDSSDSGADIQGQLHLETDDDFEGRAAAISGAGNTALDADSDTAGTGERGPAVPEAWREAGDIAPDRVVLSAREALDTSAELVSLDDPQAVDLDNLAADEDEDPEDQPA